MNSVFQDKMRSEGYRWSIFFALLVYHLVAIAAAYATFTWSGLLIGIVLYIITGLGITVGFHRLLTHQGFKTYRFVRWLAAVIAGLAGEGHCLQWVAVHRLHHQHSDQPGDPHSPRHGYVWSHVWWLFVPFTPKERTEFYQSHARDLVNDPGLLWIARTYVLQHLIVMALLLTVGYAVGGWSLALSWLVWGYFVRIVFLLNCTWLVNSLSHIAGYRSYDTEDDSRNNWLVALLAFGEGWHNNHHGKQVACNHARNWWEYLYDPSYWLIRSMAMVGLAWDLRVEPAPPPKS